MHGREPVQVLVQGHHPLEREVQTEYTESIRCVFNASYQVRSDFELRSKILM